MTAHTVRIKQKQCQAHPPPQTLTHMHASSGTGIRTTAQPAHTAFKGTCVSSSAGKKAHAVHLTQLNVNTSIGSLQLLKRYMCELKIDRLTD